ncbi:DUF1330 domain-containing protein [Candidatus Marinarcus aquaticus]|uniref:DUF1330 domain-containing protein n=1 Tax=Candidatus Marinarcus aquaticus TaxID=2044504 RepID=A0A4Q0XUP2_9BACT|nr:DUF1330 domain-containing protein [Candidatus Marinarcus aquaticus]RXJ60675.1 DUF1330 domain-containing protein [Candidatus Marinarcus aquaticus]
MFEMLVALNVCNKELYEQYTKEISSLLQEHQGSFSYDVWVEKDELENQSAHKNINRIFTLRFETKKLKEAFFNHPNYTSIKARYFDKAVNSSYIISTYHI